VLASFALMQRAFSRYGSSALTRRKRVDSSGSASRSAASDADRSSETGRSRRDTDTSLMSVSIACSAAWIPCSYWMRSTSRVTFAVTYGLPSRSPPIQLPKVTGRPLGGVCTPSLSSVWARSESTCGAASAYRSRR